MKSTRPPIKAMPQQEFIALVAMLFATVSFSIDGMLPALPKIAAELTPDDINRAQLIVTSFLLGMGIGTLFTGPLSDTFGRKKTIIGGAMLYALGAVLASISHSLEMLLVARFLQGLGAAGPRVVALAMVRDLYTGRAMARIVSFAMMVFTLVPAVAPSIGTFMILAFGWRGMFGVLICFALATSLWLGFRQPETLPKERRRSLQFRPLYAALREVMSHRVVVTSIVVQTLIYAAMFATISSTQQIFATTFGRGESFPFWFAVIAVIAGGASFLNASLVVRLGMRRLIIGTLTGAVVLSTVMSVCTSGGVWAGWSYFPAYLVWTTSVFATTGLTMGNLNAMALEPVGHIAGMAASVNGCIATVLGVSIAIPIGLAFDGTPLPLILSVAVLQITGWALMLTVPKYV